MPGRRTGERCWLFAVPRASTGCLWLHEVRRRLGRDRGLGDSTPMGLRMEIELAGGENVPISMKEDSGEEAQQNLRTRSLTWTALSASYNPAPYSPLDPKAKSLALCSPQHGICELAIRLSLPRKVEMS